MAAGLAKLVCAVCVAAVVSACLVIPHPVIPEKDKFSDKQLAFVQVGTTKRSVVEEKYGLPQISRRDGRTVVYAQARTVAGYLVGAMYAADFVPIEAYSSLIIQYDSNNCVERFDVIRGRDKCTDDGLCIEAEFGNADYDGSFYSGYVSALSNAVLLTSGERDDAAKRFLAEPEHCVVYLYNTGQTLNVKTYMASHGTLMLHNRGYIRAPVPSEPFGLHIAAEGETAKRRIECGAGELLFVNVHARKPAGIWSKEPDEPALTIGLDVAETGKSIVAGRMLIID